MLFHPDILKQNNIRNNELQIIIQTKRNRKRLRKRGRKHNKREKDLREVLDGIFKGYKIVDFIAPNEIDPYWSKIYKFYEYTKYIKYYIIKSIIFDDKILFWDYDEISEILIDLENIENKLFNYLCGYFELLIRLTLKKRFWGWKFYFNEEFIPEMWQTCITLLKSLSFDSDKAKPSVYFVNTNWFRGLQIAKDIMTKLKTEKPFYFDLNNGRMMFSDTDEVGKSFIGEESFDEIEYESVDDMKNLTEYFSEEKQTDNINNEIDNSIDEKQYDENLENNVEIELYSTEDGESIYLEKQKNETINSILEKIMKHFNFTSIDEIYSNINMVKNKINEIEFDDKEKSFIETFFS